MNKDNQLHPVLQPRSEQKTIDRLYRHISQTYDDVAKKAGLAPASFDILYVLGVDGDHVSQKDLCTVCCASKQTVHSALHRLEKQGILTIQPGQGKSTLVVLTKEGRSFITATLGPIIAAEKKALSSFSPTQLHSTLDRIGIWSKNLQEDFSKISFNQK